MTTNAARQLISKAPTPEALRDIKPPLAIPNIWAWIWWTLGALALAGLCFVIWRRWRRQKGQQPQVRLVPAHVRAKEKLHEALGLISQPKPFCTLVSDTIRFYLEECYQFHAPERTTEEFLYELQATHMLLPDQKNSLGEFLQNCDLVKFAKYEPGEPELRRLHQSAWRLIEETEPFEPGSKETDSAFVKKYEKA